MFDGLTLDQLTRLRATTQLVGVVDVLVTGEAREDGLEQKADEYVPTVLTGARIGDKRDGHAGQLVGVIQLTVQQQGIAGHLGIAG